MFFLTKPLKLRWIYRWFVVLTPFRKTFLLCEKDGNLSRILFEKWTLGDPAPKASPGGKLSKIFDFWLMRNAGGNGTICTMLQTCSLVKTALWPSSDLAYARPPSPRGRLWHRSANGWNDCIWKKFDYCLHPYGMHPVIKGLSHGLKTCPVAVPDICLRRQSALASVDRCHSLTSLYPPPAALGSLPTGMFS